ncbi:phenoloxidase-activating factor 2-like [Aricia agestis]|uniref:phenoloxidase-activating factor 2-like n=1 Tax=Aricia agestis TaxID=91739 RepID=UPI001C206805|nr:phenoloxidase-activating factor 2-like [Aricia agestis]
MKMLVILLAAACALAYPQDNTLSPQLLEEIFGTPATQRPPNPNRLEDIMVSPTTVATTYTDKNGDSCKCVPYYLCDGNDNGIYVTNGSVTGWGQLDIRFGEDECQESVEKCCKGIRAEEDVLTVRPPVARGCGYRNKNGIDVSITGGTGEEAQFGEFPWVVAILNGDSGEYGGVGVLIHPQVVMTGAHVALKFKKILIRAGEWDTQTVKERLKSQEVLVEKMVIREDFHPKSLRNDMALLLLQHPVTLDAHINVACLPDQDEDFDTAKSCFANGWGKDVFGQKGRYAVILKKVEVNMVPHATCARLMRTTRLGQRFVLHDSFVCAGGEGKDTCQGDGGAPLVCPIGGDRYKLSGLVAWGIGCNQRDVPAAYVRVAKFRTWVDGVMRSWLLPTDGYQI